MSKRIAIGGDHAGYEYKETLKAALTAAGYEVEDFGPHSADSVDYPDFAHPLSSSVEEEKNDLGILICGSGNGVCMTANKHQGIRAAQAWTPELAELARQHNDANVLCLAARFVSIQEAEAIMNAFLATDFEGGRHGRRVDKISC